MRKLYIIVTLLSIINVSYSQWVQLGNDIEGEAAYDHSGSSVCLSSDGLVIAIGAEDNSENELYAGHVRVYRYSGGSWINMGEDIDGTEEGDKLGKSVSLNYNGSIVAVGAPYHGVGSFSDRGYVRVLRYTGEDWIQMGEDILGLGINDMEGYSVSLDSAGLQLAVGSPYNHGSCQDCGQVRIFEFNNGNWEQKGGSIYGDYESDRFGWAVDLNADGNTVAIGAPYNDELGSSTGQVKVFRYDAGSWQQIGDNLFGEAAGVKFGYSVSISEDGTKLASGSPLSDPDSSNEGIAHAFELIGNSWIQTGSLGGEEAANQQGTSVCLNANGDILATGAPYYNANIENEGHAIVYKFSNGNWLQSGADIPGEHAGCLSGKSVSLNYYGNVIGIGAPNTSGNFTKSGDAKVFYNCEDSIDIISLVVTECDSYVSPSGNSVWFNSGNYTDTITVASGCELIANIELTIQNSTAIPTIIDTATCIDYISPSGKFSWNRSGTYYDTILNSLGCDSALIINLVSHTASSIDTAVCDEYVSPSGNYSWTQSGIYVDTIPNSVGCDSIITISLSSTGISNQVIVACDSLSYTSPSGNYVWTSNGIYFDTILTVAGCDSVLIIDLAFEIDTSIEVGFYSLYSNQEDASYQWLDCDNAFEPVAYGINQYFEPPHDGNYAALINKDGCIDTTYCYFAYMEIVDREEIEQLPIKVYPNPTSGKIRITGSNLQQILLFNVQGELMLLKEGQLSATEIDLGYLSSGLYLLKIVANNQTIVRKLIKE